jgi:tetratricopeptide (TPR) repeat protein
VKSRIAITIAALALATTPAYAGEPRSPEVIPQKARALAERGRAFHDAGDYGNAIVAFKEAYVMAPSPGLLFNLAQAYRLAGNCDDASLMYRRYLNTGPSPEARLIAEAHLAGTDRCTQLRGLNIRKDEAPGSSAGALRPPTRNGDTVFAEPTSKRAELKKNIGIGVALGGGIALTAAAYYAYDASSASSSVEEAYAKGAKWKDVEAIDQRGERSARYAKILGIGGGVAVVGGVTLYLLGKRAERLAPIAVVPTKHGAEVSWAWRF